MLVVVSAAVATVAPARGDDGVAPPPATTMPEVVVHGRGDGLLGTAASASQGVVGEEDLADLPLLRRGELLETVPGMVVTQHSGDGKANQYFLRGFNLDHGTDFAFSIDGVPVNLPSHAHGQGYSDLNFLIPELVGSIEFKKGPFYPEVGDFSGAGAADIHLVRTLPEGIANLQIGQFGYARALLAESPEVGPGTLLYAVEYSHYDGPWDVPEASNRANALLRYHLDRGRDSLDVSAGAYWAPAWHATDQVAQRAVDLGLIGRFGSLDPTDGGNTGRVALSAEWLRRDDGATTRVLLYGFYYRLNLCRTSPTRWTIRRTVTSSSRWIAGSRPGLTRAGHGRGTGGGRPSRTPSAFSSATTTSPTPVSTGPRRARSRAWFCTITSKRSARVSSRRIKFAGLPG